MSYEVGYDEDWQRDIGYGVPSICDHPDCNKEIDRGLDYVCGGEPYGGEYGCGLFFCEEHRGTKFADDDDTILTFNACERCQNNEEPFTPKPDTDEWIHHKETDPSWAGWRKERDETEIRAKGNKTKDRPKY